jgi:hypothetical protein
MNFLAPFFLLGGLALAAPILYHLVRRTTREKTVFSSLMFLLPSPPRLSKRHRFEHILLLILRCLALALLVFGFARPFLRQAAVNDPTAAQPKRIVLLVDTSASMRRDGVWAAARARVEEQLRRAGPADQVALMPFDLQATPLLAFEDWNRAAPGERVALALGRLATVSPSWRGTHLGNALITAADALSEEEGKAAPGPRQIVLIGDLQAGSRLDALQAYEWPKGVELRLEPVVAARTTNAGVQLVAEGPDAIRAANEPVRIRVTNSPDARREQFKLGWSRPAPAGGGAGEFIGVPIDAYVSPGQSRVFALPLPGEATAASQVTLTGDDEPFDNTAYFIPPAQQRPTVLWIGRDGADDPKQSLFFLRRALAETPRVAVKVVASPPSAPLPPADVAAASVIFVADPVSMEVAAALRAAAESGKTIVLVPKTADPAAGATLGALAGREPVRLAEMRPPSYAMLAEVDFQHPLFSPFADPRFSDFTKIHFWRYRRFSLADLPGARAIAKFDSGDPALAEMPVGAGRIYVLASGWQPDDSQLAVSSKFVPLLWSILESAGGVEAFAPHYGVGDAIAVPAEVAATAVRGPEDEVQALAAGAKVFGGAQRPGRYELTGGTRPLRFAVNLDPNESRTAPLGADELEQLGVPVTRVAPPTAAETDKQQLLQGIEAESRQKLWRWFIAATLAVLLLESALAGWTARRAALATNEASP